MRHTYGGTYRPIFDEDGRECGSTLACVVCGMSAVGIDIREDYECPGPGDCTGRNTPCGQCDDWRQKGCPFGG